MAITLYKVLKEGLETEVPTDDAESDYKHLSKGDSIIIRNADGTVTRYTVSKKTHLKELSGNSTGIVFVTEV